MIALRCPVCTQPLARQERSWLCESRHCFDVAREGYINLLLVQQKKSLNPGDTPEMLQARRDFLGAGHYAPLCESALGLLRPLHAQTLLDIGCGEGYYTRAFAELIPEVVGLDIAKAAVQIAAKRFKNITWLVGSAVALPVEDASVDVVSSLFSPLPVQEMARVLRPGGHALAVMPASTHLQTLREGLFDEVKPHNPEKYLEDFAPLFTLSEQLDVRFPLQLKDAASLRNLLLMTPYYWRAKQDRREAMLAREHFETEAVFSLFLLQKKA